MHTTMGRRWIGHGWIQLCRGRARKQRPRRRPNQSFAGTAKRSVTDANRWLIAGIARESEKKARVGRKSTAARTIKSRRKPERDPEGTAREIEDRSNPEQDLDGSRRDQGPVQTGARSQRHRPRDSRTGAIRKEKLKGQPKDRGAGASRIRRPGGTASEATNRREPGRGFKARRRAATKRKPS
jgi:hypothetical protein